MKKVTILIFLTFTSVVLAQKSTKDLLQGKWQSVEDKNNILWFSGNLRKETADRKTWDSEEFKLSSKCENESDIESVGNSVKSNFISCKESDMCWEIASVTSTTLNLIYTARGNTLTYKRIK
jgi:hypothetical protein